MTKFEFETEWARVVRHPFEFANPKGIKWYDYAVKRLPYLSLEAKQYIVDNPNDFGDWLLEHAAVYSLERALGLEVV